MCFFSAPKMPKVEYVGPSEDQIAANNAALDEFRANSLAQQENFASSLQVQIDAANQRAEQMRAQLEADRNAALAQQAAQQTAAYSVTTQMSEPVNAKTTEEIKPKKDDTKTSLKIARGSVPTSAGTGINVGV